MKFKIGHGSYTGTNALKYVGSGTAAVAELQSRGVIRSVARDAVKRAQETGPCQVNPRTGTELIELEVYVPQ